MRYDFIVASAAARDSVPPALLARLAPGGRLLAPLALSEAEQAFVVVDRTADGVSEPRQVCPARFVGLVGAV